MLPAANVTQASLINFVGEVSLLLLPPLRLLRRPPPYVGGGGPDTNFLPFCQRVEVAPSYSLQSSGKGGGMKKATKQAKAIFSGLFPKRKKRTCLCLKI